MTSPDRNGDPPRPRERSGRVLGDFLDELGPDLAALAGLLARKHAGAAGSRATSLAHDAFVRLAQQAKMPCESREHGLAIAAKAVRSVLVDRYRREVVRADALADRRRTADPVPDPEDGTDLVAVHESLDELAAFDARKAAIVEMRFFAGSTVKETARALGVSPATVKREWTLAKAWLLRSIEGRR